MIDKEKATTFPKLLEFVDQGQNQNTFLIPPDVISEINMLLNSFELVKNDKNIEGLLKKMQIIEEENESLKKEIEGLKSNIKIERVRKKTIVQQNITDQQMVKKIQDDYENQVLELENQIQVLKDANSKFQIQISSTQINENKKELDLEDKVKENTKLEQELSTIKDKAKIDTEGYENKIKTLQNELNDKKKECDNLRMNLKKTNKEAMKLRKINELLRSTHKSSEIQAKNLKRELNELKEQHSLFIESSDKRFDKDNQLIITLVNNIRQEKFDMKALDELLEKFNKRKMVFDDSISINNGEKSLLNQETKKLGNLEEYEQLFEDSIQFTNQEESLNFEEGNFTLTENDNQNETFEINQTLDHQANIVIGNNQNFINQKKKESRKSLNDFKGIEMKKKFNTNRDEILKDLNEQIGSKIKFQTSMQMQIQKSEMNGQQIETEEPQEMQDTLKDMRVPTQKQQLFFDSEIEEKVFNFALDELENYLLSEKNPTTFSLNGYEKRTTKNKFEKTKNKTLQKYTKIFQKLFLHQINFLESQIKNLTHHNSFLEIKLDNLKSEMNFLLQTFLEKNQQNQQLMNETNKELLKLKKKNRIKLETFNKQRQQRKKEKMQQFINEQSIKESQIQSKKSNKRYTRPITDADYANTEQILSQNSDEENENIWSKVTNFFKQFQILNNNQKQQISQKILMLDQLLYNQENKSRANQIGNHYLLDYCTSFDDANDYINQKIEYQNNKIIKYLSFKEQFIRFLEINNFRDYILIISISSIASILALFITKLSGFFFRLKYQFSGDNLIIFSILSILSAILASFICEKISKLAQGSGIPEIKTILSGVDYYKFLNFKTMIAKYLSIFFVKIAGLGIGFEAAFIHITANVAEALTQISFFRKFQKSSQKKMAIAASLCVGITISFNAPLSGIIFAIEMITVNFQVTNLFKNFIAATIAYFCCEFLQNIFGIKYIRKEIEEKILLHELHLFMIFGILIGLLASLFLLMYSKIIPLIKKQKSIFFTNRYLYITIGTLIISFLNFQHDSFQFGFKEIIHDLINFNQMHNPHSIINWWYKDKFLLIDLCYILIS